MALNNSNLNNSTSKPNAGAKQGNLLVRIDQDSAENLQALFDSVLRPHDTTRKLTKPFRMRDLPPSFFNPPLTGSKSPSVSHSRENSADSAFGSGTTTICSPSGVNPTVNRLPISHSRAHSSPASLQQTYAGLNNNSSNNNSNATTQQQQGQQTQSTTQAIQPVHMKQRSYDVVSAIQLQEELGELPAGWEQARTAEGQIYYLNHLTRTTQWEDPRKQVAAQPPLSQHQSTDSLLANNLARAQIQQQQQQQQQQQATSQAATAASKPIISTNALGQLGTLPEGWEQAITSAGETYFINHINSTTSWFDPRVPRIPEQFQRSNPLSAPRIEMNVGLGNTSYINIHKLKREVDSLKQRQQEIQLFNQDLLARQNQQSIAHQMDPFLSGVTDHTRQESADSGLSVSSTNYSMPHTPDFMANIDDSMDCISESGTMESINTNLESTDDLVPSLHQLGDGFSNELLDDVHNLIDTAATKPLTWL